MINIKLKMYIYVKIHFLDNERLYSYFGQYDQRETRNKRFRIAVLRHYAINVRV
jgi:hypothetical protein